MPYNICNYLFGVKSCDFNTEKMLNTRKDKKDDVENRIEENEPEIMSAATTTLPKTIATRQKKEKMLEPFGTQRKTTEAHRKTHEI